MKNQGHSFQKNTVTTIGHEMDAKDHKSSNTNRNSLGVQQHTYMYTYIQLQTLVERRTAFLQIKSLATLGNKYLSR